MKFRNQFMNEGTQATIAVTMKDGSILQSLLQYDGYEDSAGKDLIKYYDSQKGAEKLVSKTGELRSIYDGKPDYYSGRKLLKKFSNEQGLERSPMMAQYNYLWTGEEWLVSVGTMFDWRNIN